MFKNETDRSLPFANGLELCLQTSRPHSVGCGECGREVCTHNSKPFANGRDRSVSFLNIHVRTTHTTSPAGPGSGQGDGRFTRLEARFVSISHICVTNGLDPRDRPSGDFGRPPPARTQSACTPEQSAHSAHVTECADYLGAIRSRARGHSASRKSDPEDCIFCADGRSVTLVLEPTRPRAHTARRSTLS